MSKAEEAVDEYLAWEDNHPQPDLNKIEEIALVLRKALGREIAQMAVDEQEKRQVVPGPSCQKCGKEMRYKGEKEIEVESRVGALKVGRGYYCCAKCQESIFPLAEQVGANRDFSQKRMEAGATLGSSSSKGRSQRKRAGQSKNREFSNGSG